MLGNWLKVESGEYKLNWNENRDNRWYRKRIRIEGRFKYKYPSDIRIKISERIVNNEGWQRHEITSE